MLDGVKINRNCGDGALRSSIPVLRSRSHEVTWLEAELPPRNWLRFIGDHLLSLVDHVHFSF